MHLVHSVLNMPEKSGSDTAVQPLAQELQLRLKAHQEVCDRYRQHITAIQQWMPNWKPTFKI